MITPKRDWYFLTFVLNREVETYSKEQLKAILDRLDLDDEQVLFVSKADDVTKTGANLVIIGDENDNCSLEDTEALKKLVYEDVPHLHLHDEYSLRDGLGTIEQRVELMKENRWTYLTATNHGSLGCWVKQYITAKKKGLKPIFGIEAYVNEHRLYTKEQAAEFDDVMKKRYRKNNHVTMYARTKEGWDNLIKVHNDAHVRGFYYVPRTDPDFMISHGRGVIATTGDVVSGEIPRLLADESIPWEERLEKAKTRYEMYKNAFDGFYIELNVTDFKPLHEMNRLMVTFGEWVGAEYVLTCDSHYLRKADSVTHDILLMLRDKKTMADKAVAHAAGKLKELGFDLAVEEGRKYLSDMGLIEAVEEYNNKIKEISKDQDLGKEDDVWEFDAKDLYMKTFAEMKETWDKMKDDVLTEEIFWKAMQGTRKIARSVETFTLDTSLKIKKMSEEPDEELRRQCLVGLKRLKLDDKKEYQERLDYELDVIKQKGFSDYFLVFSKIVEFCEREKIARGVARGSAGGCLISYCLDITRIDPIIQGLLFERFMDPGRADSPDIDGDFDKDRREDVKQGMRDIFGKECVCAAGSYQMIKTKNVIKDIARVFCIPAAQVNELTKKLSGSYSDGGDDDEDETPLDKIPWNELVEREPLMKEFFARYPQLGQHCERLRGQIRNAGQHPAGVIVASVNLLDWMPIRLEDGEFVSCWTEGLSLRELQEMGFVKYDILGLRTVSILTGATNLINETTRIVTMEDGTRVRWHKNERCILNDGIESTVFRLHSGDTIVRVRRPDIKMLDGCWIVSYETSKTGNESLMTDLRRPWVVKSVTQEIPELTMIPLDDKASLTRINNLDVFGVFQFETPTAVKVIKTIGIDEFDDMNIATALGRPDPMSGKMHEIYGRRKHGEEAWSHVLALGDIFKKTKNLPIFQENSMIFAQRIGGFSPTEANALRKGLAKGKDSEENLKKLHALLADLKTRSQPAVERGDISQEILDEMVSQIEKFGGYGFNLSHSASYAMIGYHSLFLKTHYPAQFMCALFNFTDRNKEDKAGNSIIARYVRYCKQRGIKVLPPSVMESGIKFSLTVDGNIRWGLGDIKSVGVAADEIALKQPFVSLEDFLDKVEKRKVNKAKVLALIKAGALDCFGKRVDIAKEYATKMKVKEDEMERWVVDPKTDEVDLLGFCISEKVVPDVDPEWMTANCVLTLGEMAEMKKGLFFGRIKDAKKRKSRASGKEMMVASLHDDSHDAEFFVWEKDIAYCEEKLKKGALVVVPLKQFDDGGGWFYCGPKTHLLVIEEEKT